VLLVVLVAELFLKRRPRRLLSVVLGFSFPVVIYLGLALLEG
jgi:hypothetical protein